MSRELINDSSTMIRGIRNSAIWRGRFLSMFLPACWSKLRIPDALGSGITACNNARAQVTGNFIHRCRRSESSHHLHNKQIQVRSSIFIPSVPIAEDHYSNPK